MNDTFYEEGVMQWQLGKEKIQKDWILKIFCYDENILKIRLYRKQHPHSLLTLNQESCHDDIH